MASLNDYKILNRKCLSYFQILEKELGKKIHLKTDSDKERFGFYLYMIECICNIKDVAEIVDLITDTDFNSKVLNQPINDNGVDAIYLDESTNTINLFNFKFRENFSKGKQQSLNDPVITTKFANAILNEDTSHLEGKLKEKADEILKCLKSRDTWSLKLYVVSNEDIELDTNKSEIQQLEKTYDLQIIPIGLNKIADFMSKRPERLNASLVVDLDAVMSYSETELTSAKSFILRLNVSELIRITCDNNEFREKHNIENISPLTGVDLEYSLLYDNVRGFLGETKYNKNIVQTLKNEPTKFFMYNNGLTITAENIEATPINANKKIKIVITNFQVVNGGQTLRTIHNFNNKDKDNLNNFLSNSEILIRIFKTGTTVGFNQQNSRIHKQPECNFCY